MPINVTACYQFRKDITTGNPEITIKILVFTLAASSSILFKPGLIDL